MKLESIEKLNLKAEEYVKLGFFGDAVCLRRLANEIEREIAEKYMELPVDADDVPIKPGDELEYCSEDIIHISGVNLGNVSGRTRVIYIAFDCDGCIAIQGEDDEESGEPPAFFRSHDDMNYRHAKPDKLKERVRKFIHDRRGLNLKDPQEKADRMLDEFCADIREMAKEDEL